MHGRKASVQMNAYPDLVGFYTGHAAYEGLVQRLACFNHLWIEQVAVAVFDDSVQSVA